MEFYDVVIVGAGPAGLACAEKLGQAGKKVLLLEQNSEVGSKVCAGGLTSNFIGGSKLPEDLFEYKFKDVSIYNYSNKLELRSSKFLIYTVDRKDLGQWQLKKILKNTNIIVKVNSRVTEVNKNYVVVNGKEKIGFEYLVGSDGSSSLVRRFLGTRTNILIMGIQYIIPERKYNKLEMFFDFELFNFGYVWIFPHRNFVSIGCGCITKFMSAKKLREGFEKWLKENNIDVSGGRFEAFPINFDYQGYKFGNIFLAGDAAGFASALTGEGIGQAAVSGEEVAKTIIDKNYHSKKIDEMLKIKKRQEKILSFFRSSGRFAKVEFRFLLYLLKNKSFADFIMKHLL